MNELNYALSAILGGVMVLLIKYLFGKVAKDYVQRDDLEKYIESHKNSCQALVKIQELRGLSEISQKDIKTIQKVLLEVAVKVGVDANIYKELTQ